MSQSNPSNRVFVDIKATDEISDGCMKLHAELTNLPARLTRAEDMHLTLLPPWQMKDQKLVEKQMRKALWNIESFTLEFTLLSFGPDNIRLRLVWITGIATDEIVRLNQALDNTFGREPTSSFLPHISIARFAKKDRWRLVGQTIEQSISLKMPVKSVELYESAKSNGNLYRVLTLVPISKAGPVLNGPLRRK